MKRPWIWALWIFALCLLLPPSPAHADDLELCNTAFPPAAEAAQEHGVACSLSLLTYDESKSLFGKRIAGRYVVVQVRVRNLDGQHAYILHDIVLGYQGQATGGRIRDAVAVAIQQDDFRDVALRTLRGVGLITGAVASFVPEAVVIGGGILAGPVLEIFQREVPDITGMRIERLQSLGWAPNPIVLSQDAAATALVFLPQSVFFSEQERKQFRKSTEALLSFQSELQVAIAGLHVQAAANHAEGQ